MIASVLIANPENFEFIEFLVFKSFNRKKNCLEVTTA